MTASAAVDRCPRCGRRDAVRGVTFLELAGVFFVSGSCLLWIPVLGWVLAPLLFLATLACALMGGLPRLFPFARRLRFCGTCKGLFWAPRP